MLLHQLISHSKGYTSVPHTLSAGVSRADKYFSAPENELPWLSALKISAKGAQSITLQSGLEYQMIKFPI